MNFEPFDPDKFIREMNNKPDYNTNSGTYYKELARKQELIRLLSKKIWEYDVILKDKLAEIERVLTNYGDILDGKLENFDKTVLDLTQKWLDEHLHDILTAQIKTVWFGLTDDGYFMAVIPESWDEITFDTNTDGHLILEY